MTKYSVTLLKLALIILMIGVATYIPVAAQDEKPEIVIAYDGDIDHIELHEFRSVAAYDATANLYEPMITQVLVQNEAGQWIGQREMEGAVAESYEVSEDGTVFTFHLREDAMFADGTPITANDYKFTFDRAIQGERSYIGLLTAFMAISSADQVEVIDDYTLQVTTDLPAALTETIIAFQVFGAISQATAEANATDEDTWAFDYFRANSNSSGPYVISEWNAGVEYTFEPNPNYWRGADWFQNSGVIFRVVPDSSTRLQLLREGDVDVALGVAFADLEALEADENVNVNAIPTTRLYHLGMNNAVAPFDNELVRQAVSMAIPYDAIIDNVILGYGQQPRSPVSVGMEGYTDAHWNYGDGDMDAARALLEEAGYPDGFEVDLTIPQEDQSRVDAATWIQSGLAEIGITVNINAVPAGEYAGLLNALDDNGQHPLPFFIQEWYSWGNDPFYQLTFNLKCGAFTNYVNYCNPEVDGIIEAGTFSRDPEERAALLDRVQQVIVEEAPWAYLYQPDWIVATGADVTGIALFDDLTLRYGYLGRSE